MTMAPTQHLFPNMSALNPIDMKMNGSCGGGGEKQLKTEYKPEQLASLLQAAASQPVPVMMTSAVSNSSPHLTSSLAQGNLFYQFLGHGLVVKADNSRSNLAVVYLVDYKQS
jgi:hypothetical protein